MPQASDELRDKMGKYFGDRIDDKGPTDYLLRRGFSFSWSGLILPPNRTRIDNKITITRKEWDCMEFLGDEWDYGWKFNSRVRR